MHAALASMTVQSRETILEIAFLVLKRRQPFLVRGPTMGPCLGKMPQPRPGQPGYNPNGQGQYGQGQYGQQQQHGQGGHGQQGGGYGQPGQFQDAGETKTDTGAPSPNGVQGGGNISQVEVHKSKAKLALLHQALTRPPCFMTCICARPGAAAGEGTSAGCMHAPGEPAGVRQHYRARQLFTSSLRDRQSAPRLQMGRAAARRQATRQAATARVASTSSRPTSSSRPSMASQDMVSSRTDSRATVRRATRRARPQDTVQSHFMPAPHHHLRVVYLWLVAISWATACMHQVPCLILPVSEPARPGCA